MSDKLLSSTLICTNVDSFAHAHGSMRLSTWKDLSNSTAETFEDLSVSKCQPFKTSANCFYVNWRSFNLNTPCSENKLLIFGLIDSKASPVQRQVLLQTKTLTQTSPGPTSATLSPKQRIIELCTKPEPLESAGRSKPSLHGSKKLPDEEAGWQQAVVHTSLKTKCMEIVCNALDRLPCS